MEELIWQKRFNLEASMITAKYFYSANEVDLKQTFPVDRIFGNVTPESSYCAHKSLPLYPTPSGPFW
jgi:hypothetical protein